MAIINTYPSATPKGADLLIGTQVKDDTVLENSTKSFSINAIGSFLITSNDIVTGSGTTDQVVKFTDGPKGVVGDSLIKSYTFAPGTGNEEDRVECSGVVISNIGRFNSVQTDSIVASDTGSVTMNGNVNIGNASTDELNIVSTTNIFNAPIKAGPIPFGALAPGVGYILASTASSALEWTNIEGISGSVTGSGTTDTLPIFTDGPNGVLGDSIITQDTIGVDTVNVAGRLSVDGDLIVDSRAVFNGLYARFLGQVQDNSNSPGTSGQLLTSTVSGVEWVDPQNVVSPYIRSEKVTVSTAELKDLHNTPKILVDVTAGNPKEICQVYSVVFSVGGNNFGDNLTFPNDITIQSDNVNPWKYIIPQATANAEFIPFYVPSLTAGLSDLDSDVVLSSAGAAVETGTAPTTMTIWITYRIFEINA